MQANAVSNWDDLEPIDQYMMAKTAQLLVRRRAGLRQLHASTASTVPVYDFVNDLSSVYMDVTKDRLYSESPDSPRRRAVQTVLFEHPGSACARAFAHPVVHGR